MAHLQALVERAGGAAAFNAIAAVVLNQPAPAADVEPANEFDNLAEWQALTAAIQSAHFDFLGAPPNDNSPIAAALLLRPYGLRREGGANRWWRRLAEDPSGRIDCTHADILAVHLEWLRRFRRFYNHIHRRPMGPNVLSRATFAARQALFEASHQAHILQQQPPVAPIALESDSDDETQPHALSSDDVGDC